MIGYVVVGHYPDGTIYVANGGAIHRTESEAGKVAHLFNRFRPPRGVVYAVGVVTYANPDFLPAELR